MITSCNHSATDTLCGSCREKNYRQMLLEDKNEQLANLLTRHNALVIEHAALLINHNALVEAAKKMLDAYKRAEECSCPYCLEDFERERAEVDRLMGGE